MPGAVLWVWALASTASWAQEPASPGAPDAPAGITGTVTDAASKQVLPDAYVTLQSPALPSEQLAVTDGAGQYRVNGLPPGTYSLRFERPGSRPLERREIAVAAGQAVVVNAELAPEGAATDPTSRLVAPPGADARPPGAEQGSDPAPVASASSASGTAGRDFTQGAAVIRPGLRGSAGRSLELLAGLLPGARVEPLGLSLSGASPLENLVLVDGLSVVDPATGALAFPLSTEFIESMDVLAGGYLPELGRAAGGTLRVETRSGSNEWHGSAYSRWTPGGLEGGRAPAAPRLSSVVLSQQLWHQGELGAQLSGPLVRDRLWLFVGLQAAAERIRLTRSYVRMSLVNDPSSGLLVYDVDPRTGLERTEEIQGAAQSWFGDYRQLQYLAKLTFFPDPDRTVSLMVAGTPSRSGGPGRFGYGALTGAVDGWGPGTAGALQRSVDVDTRQVVLRGSSAFWDRLLTVDASVGWYRQVVSTADSRALALLPQVIFRNGAQPGPHSLNDFAAVLARDGDPLAAQVVSACTDGAGLAPGVRRCPVPLFTGGGTGELGYDIQDRVQGRAVATYLLGSLGHHVIKAGAEGEWLRLNRESALTGGVLREGDPEATLDDFRAYGTVDGGGQAIRAHVVNTATSSLSAGAFLQDSWHVLDMLQVNLGVRWDGQALTGPDGQTAFALWNQLSPRAGLALDPTNAGRSRLYWSYARFTQAVSLDLVQRAFGGERYALARHAAGGACNPLDPDAWLDPSRCQSPAVTGPAQAFGAARPEVDPQLQATSTDEMMAGAEYEVLPDLRAGASYTRRTLVASLRALSVDGGATTFIGNPGVGLGSGFERASRSYDAVSVTVDRAFARRWMAHASYTWSWLRGNEPGLHEPPSRLDNGTGPLPGDHTHQVRVFGGYDFALPGRASLIAGGAYLAESGAPTSVLGSHPFSGDGAVFLLPRGSGPRLPWVHSVDLHLALEQPLPGGLSLQVAVDAFNVLNFQAVTAIDERYTLSDAVPFDCPCSEADLANARTPDGQAVVPNPNFRRPVAHQLPRSVRLGAKLSF